MGPPLLGSGAGAGQGAVPTDQHHDLTTQFSDINKEERGRGAVGVAAGGRDTATGKVPSPSLL